MSVPSAPKNQLEESLARLSQQMESVEGRFNKILGPDARNSARNSHVVESQVYRSSNRNSYIPESQPASSYTTRNYSYSTNVNPLEQPKSSHSNYQVERSNNYYTSDLGFTPGNNYRYSETVKRSAPPASASKYQHDDFSTTKTYTATTTYEVKPAATTTTTPQKDTPATPSKTEEESPNHDFNDKELLAMILNENSALKGGVNSSPNSKVITHSHDPLKYENVKRSYILENHHQTSSPVVSNAKVEEILRSIAAERASQGGEKKYSKPEDLKTYSTVTTTTYSPSKDYSETVKRSSRPPRLEENVTKTTTTTTTYTPTTYTPTKNTEYLISKSSLPLETSVYVGSQPTQTGSETKKVEEWQYRKYLNQAPAAAEEEDDDGSNFCGVCVSKRNVKKN